MQVLFLNTVPFQSIRPGPFTVTVTLFYVSLPFLPLGFYRLLWSNYNTCVLPIFSSDHMTYFLRYKPVQYEFSEFYTTLKLSIEVPLCADIKHQSPFIPAYKIRLHHTIWSHHDANPSSMIHCSSCVRWSTFQQSNLCSRSRWSLTAPTISQMTSTLSGRIYRKAIRWLCVGEKELFPFN